MMISRKYITNSIKQKMYLIQRFNSSKTHFERRKLNYSQLHVYNVIADVESYHKFVPWCKKSKLLNKTPKGFEAELMIGFGPFEEKYVSDVELVYPTIVNAKSTQTTLLDHLCTEWTITPSNDNTYCWVSFRIDFKFKSAVYSHISDLFFSDIVKKMVQAFETRCKSIK